MMNSSTTTLKPAVVPEQKSAAPTSMGSLLGSSVRAAVLVMLVSGVAYPLLTTGVAQAVFPKAANGSLIEHNGQVVGSALIGQSFSGAGYFHSRPSATTAADPAKEGATMAAPYNAGASAGSNQGATSQGLFDAVSQRVQDYRAVQGMDAGARVPVDAVTASASGLDPHISLANAQLQLPRVAQARGLNPEQVQTALAQATESRTLGLLGEPRVNVLQLNLALDALVPTAARKE